MKTCSECRVDFEPTNNRQLACSACKTAREVRLKREKRQTSPDLQRRCREATQRYRDQNRELVRQRDRERYWSNPQLFRDKSNQYNKNNRELLTEHQRKWRADNREHLRQWERDRYHNNPDINKKKKERARQRRFGNVDINEIYARDGRVCFYCGDTSGPFHIDHKTPLSRGGKNTKDNLTVACANCNLRKYTMTAEEFQSC